MTVIQEELGNLCTNPVLSYFQRLAPYSILKILATWQITPPLTASPTLLSGQVFQGSAKIKKQVDDYRMHRRWEKQTLRVRLRRDLALINDFPSLKQRTR
jgi:hypothetical protein